MYMLVYVSSAVNKFSDEDLVALLIKSRKNNEALGVTGMLLYKDGNFMQILEGPKETVQALAAKIGLDPRHTGVLTLLQREQEEREFGEWQMGFKNLDHITDELPGYSEFLKVSFDSEEYARTPSKALKLLLNFKSMMR